MGWEEPKAAGIGWVGKTAAGEYAGHPGLFWNLFAVWTDVGLERSGRWEEAAKVTEKEWVVQEEKYQVSVLSRKPGEGSISRRRTPSPVSHAAETSSKVRTENSSLDSPWALTGGLDKSSLVEQRERNLTGSRKQEEKNWRQYR